MLVFCLLLSTLLLAAVSFWLLYTGLARTPATGWHRAALGLSLGVFIYLYGTWVYLSVNAKYFFAGCLGALLLTGIFLPLKKRGARPGGWRLGVNLLLVLVFGGMSVLYFTGTLGKPETVDLHFPLKGGRYFVLQGGKGLPANFFHYSYRGAVYAMDLARLNQWGNRATGIAPARLEDYYIFGDTVFSPCDGIVEGAREENPDNVPGVRERGPSNLNMVLIRTDSFYVFMGHLKKNSLLVREGQPVHAGQPLALVGNSGFSLEPHLHIQVHAREGDDVPWYRCRPLYIQFDGRSYLLFEEIRAVPLR